MNKQRVVVTGFGGLTACGETITETWQAIKQGESGIAPITQWDSSEWPYPLAGELKDYQPRKLLQDRKLFKVLSRHDVIGLNAVQQAIEHSQLLSYRDQLNDPTELNDRTGVYAASPGNKFNQQYEFLPLLTDDVANMREFAGELFNTVNPMWLLKILPNNVLAYTGIQYGFKGANQNITNHAVSGAQAIIEAVHAIQSGQIERAVVVGYDVAIEPQGLMYYANLGLLSNTSVKPFDHQHDGTIMAEGAGAIVIESAGAAQARQATVYGEILGGVTTAEAGGIFALEEQGEGLSRALSCLLEKTQLTTNDIGMITTHGNGNASSDITETYALNRLFKQSMPPACAFKWAIGHTVAAVGVIETILTLNALREAHIPGVSTFTHTADECKGMTISAEVQQPHSSTALTISRAFGGLSSCLMLRV